MTPMLTTLTMTIGLIILALGNEYLFHFTEVTSGVNWIYLPAGLRMCYVLVIPLQGTVAIFLAGIWLGARDPALSGLWLFMGAAVTAAGPILARAAAMQAMGLKPSLDNLTSRKLCALAAVFGLVSSTLHQAYYLILGREPAFIPMWIGDTLGCLLCLYALKALAACWKSRRGS